MVGCVTPTSSPRARSTTCHDARLPCVRSSSRTVGVERPAVSPTALGLFASRGAACGGRNPAQYAKDVYSWRGGKKVENRKVLYSERTKNERSWGISSSPLPLDAEFRLSAGITPRLVESGREALLTPDENPDLGRIAEDPAGDGQSPALHRPLLRLGVFPVDRLDPHDERIRPCRDDRAVMKPPSSR